MKRFLAPLLRWAMDQRLLAGVLASLIAAGILGLLGLAVSAYHEDETRTLGPSDIDTLTLHSAGALGDATPDLAQLLGPGGVVLRVRLSLTNSTKTALDGLSVRVDPSAGLAIVPGSVSWSGEVQESIGLPDETVLSGEPTLPSLGAGESVWIDFRVRVDAHSSCSSIIESSAEAVGIGPVSATFVYTLDQNGDGVADGASCPTTQTGGGFGPERPVLNWADPKDRKGSGTAPVFNSFINTPNYGDERNFVVAARGDRFDASLVYRDPLSDVSDSGSLVIRVLVSNDAQDTLGGPGGVGRATGTTVRLDIGGGYTNGIDLTAYVTAENAVPREIYDNVAVRDARQSFAVAYRPGSARIFNQKHPEGLALPDSIVTIGCPIGSEAMDGVFDPQGSASYVTVVVDIVPSW